MELCYRAEVATYALLFFPFFKAKYSFNSNLLFPQFSILDPETTMSLPTRQTANGVVDSFVHVCEQYLTVCLSTYRFFSVTNRCRRAGSLRRGSPPRSHRQRSLSPRSSSLGQAGDGQSALLHCSKQHHVGCDAGSQQMALAGRDRGLGDAYDRPRAHCLSRNGSCAYSRLHSGRIEGSVARSRAFCGSNSTRRCRNWRRWECECSGFRVIDEQWSEG